MRRRTIKAAAAVLLMGLTCAGCYDRIDMEDAAFSLVAGLDLNEQRKLVQYTSIPVFSKNNAGKKSREFAVTADTLRQGRGKLDAFTVGEFQGRKIQFIVLSKRFVQNRPRWFRYFDVYFRDGRNPITPRVLVYDGDLADLYRYTPKDELILPLMLTGLVESSVSRSETVRTTLQELHRQMAETGQTPALTEISLNQELKIDGAALLDHAARYVGTIDGRECALLRILQKRKSSTAGFTLRMPQAIAGEDETFDWISVNADQARTRIVPSYSRGRFRFDVSIRLRATMMERLFPFDSDHKLGELETAIAEEIRRQFETFTEKLQRMKVDPVGFGIYARAREYRAFREAESRWGETFAQAKIVYRVSVSLQDEGAVR